MHFYLLPKEQERLDNFIYIKQTFPLCLCVYLKRFQVLKFSFPVGTGFSPFSSFSSIPVFFIPDFLCQPKIIIYYNNTHWGSCEQIFLLHLTADAIFNLLFLDTWIWKFNISAFGWMVFYLAGLCCECSGMFWCVWSWVMRFWWIFIFIHKQLKTVSFL